MKASSMLRKLLFVAGLALAAGAGAQTPAFKPEVGQAGKDVVWVPTSDVLVSKMLDMAKATPSDYLIDLGSGDGRTVIAAAKRGLKAHGIEYNPDMVTLSQANAAKAGVSDKATFAKADIFQSDFSQASIITLFLLPDLNLKLRPIILNLKPGTRIVSNSFTMGDWEDDDTATAGEGGDCSYWCIAHMWIVPAKVGGSWAVGKDSVVLNQKYQMLNGSMTKDGKKLVVKGKMRGDQINFDVILPGDEKMKTKDELVSSYSGRASGNTIEGTVKTGTQSGKWVATRAK